MGVDEVQVKHTVESASDYYPYGKALRSYGQERYQSTYHERDVESGFDYRGARFYDSDVVRFNSLDPLAADFVSLSDYMYVAGNPLHFIDKDGKQPGKNNVTTVRCLIENLRAANVRNMQEMVAYFGNNRSGQMFDSSSGRGEEWQYIYTEGAGWIDVTHFATSAKFSPGRTMQDIVEATHFLEKRQEGEASHYSYEDFQSNIQGYIFYKLYGDAEGEDFYEALQEHFENLLATNPEAAPNWLDLPEKADAKEYANKKGIKNIPKVKTPEKVLFAPQSGALAKELEYKTWSVREQELHDMKAQGFMWGSRIPPH